MSDSMATVRLRLKFVHEDFGSYESFLKDLIDSANDGTILSVSYFDGFPDIIFVEDKFQVNADGKGSYFLDYVVVEVVDNEFHGMTLKGSDIANLEENVMERFDGAFLEKSEDVGISFQIYYNGCDMPIIWDN